MGTKSGFPCRGIVGLPLWRGSRVVAVGEILVHHRFKLRLVAAALGGAAALFAGPSRAGALSPPAGDLLPDLRVTRVVPLPDGPGFLVRVENSGGASSRPTRLVLRTAADVVEAEVVALAPDGLAFVRIVPRTDVGRVASFRVDPAGLVEESVEVNNDATWVAR